MESGAVPLTAVPEANVVVFVIVAAAFKGIRAAKESAISRTGFFNRISLRNTDRLCFHGTECIIRWLRLNDSDDYRQELMMRFAGALLTQRDTEEAARSITPVPPLISPSISITWLPAAVVAITRLLHSSFIAPHLPACLPSSPKIRKNAPPNTKIPLLRLPTSPTSPNEKNIAAPMHIHPHPPSHQPPAKATSPDVSLSRTSNASSRRRTGS